jgi:hypothetical protein
MNQRQKDLNFGQKFENVNLEILSKYFKCDELMKTINSRDPFDYIDKKNKVIIELKARRNTKEKYYDTMIGHNKILSGFKHIQNGYKVYLCFQFTDGLFYYQLNEETYDKSFIRAGGRCDRGSFEINQYYYIPNKILTKIV